jgi:hypothetical protein
VSLLLQVTQELGGDESKAIDSLGALFMTIRFSLDTHSFKHVQQAVPNADEWVTRAATGGGRTGEMLALTTPASLASRLQRSGLDTDEQARMGGVVMQYLSQSVPTDVLNTLSEKIAILSVQNR